MFVCISVFLLIAAKLGQFRKKLDTLTYFIGIEPSVGAVIIFFSLAFVAPSKQLHLLCTDWSKTRLIENVNVGIAREQVCCAFSPFFFVLHSFSLFHLLELWGWCSTRFCCGEVGSTSVCEFGVACSSRCTFPTDCAFFTFHYCPSTGYISQYR